MKRRVEKEEPAQRLGLLLYSLHALDVRANHEARLTSFSCLARTANLSLISSSRLSKKSKTLSSSLEAAEKT